ncbi:MAG: hypothetical protein ACI8QG_000472 [Flavobacteriales bacterium]|jgi:hypothetical protein
MEINNKPLSLFNYIADYNKSSDVLQSLAKTNNKDISGGLDVLESGLNKRQFEETLKRLEKGEIDIDLNLVDNYYQLNQQKPDREISQLAKNFELSSEVAVTLQDGKLVAEGETKNAKTLQQYFDKDTRLNSLVQ